MPILAYVTNVDNMYLGLCLCVIRCEWLCGMWYEYVVAISSKWPQGSKLPGELKWQMNEQVQWPEGEM